MSSTFLRSRLLQACRSPSILLLKYPPLAVSASGVGTVRRASNALQTNVASLLAQASKTATSPTDSSTNRLVSVSGFIQTIRRQKRIAFAAIGDGTSLQSLQAVLSPELADGLSTGAGVTITGELRPSPGGKEQTHELHAQYVEILGEHDAAAYPLQKKYHTPEFLRSIPHLRTRLPANSLLLRLRSQAISDASKYFSEHGFIQTHPPLITSSDCEGAGEVFTVEANRMEPEVSASTGQASQLKDDTFFRMPKYLTVSTQLHLESLAMAVGKVWTLSPTFRAERSDTARHLSEFYMLEAEMAFTNQLCDVMDTVEGLLKVVSSHLQSSKIGEELLHLRHNTIADSTLSSTPADNVLQRRWGVLSEGNWPRITYREAIDRIEHVATHKGAFFETVPTFKSGLQVEHEKFLAKDVGSDGPVFVTHYPRSQKAFYMAASANNAEPLNDEATVDCFDLLVPDICELVGGSLREYRYRDLVKSMNAHGMSSGGAPICNSSHPQHGEESLPNAAKQDDGPLQWYSDLRKFGSVPHGGFGIGFDRLLCYLSGMSNIRDVVAFPRWYGRCDC